MRVIQEINLSNIIVDKHSISPETFNLAQAIYSGKVKIEDLPPIKVVPQDSNYLLRDGRHRVTAFKLLGLTKIKAKYYESR